MVQRYLFRTAVLAVAVLLPGLASADGQIYTEDGVALGGTDPVAYFSAGEPQSGSAEHSYQWRGAEWHFVSERHRQRFAENPQAYAPEYGGWCAWAAARGDAAPTSPEAWKIVDGELYLNYDQEIQARWESDIEGFIEAADQHWPDIF